MNALQEERWHQLSHDEVLKQLETDPQTGLNHSSIDARQEQFGPNALTQRKGQGPLVRFLLQFHQALVYILLAAVIIKLLLGAWVDASVIFGVVLLNSIIGFLQESKALSALDALSRAMVTETTVLRDGEKQRIDARSLVPGDVVLLASGDKVPADLRLLQSRSLQVDESALTGESVPVEKRIGGLETDTSLADRVNMAYSSTLVTYGTGLGVVTTIGDRTEIGRISELIASAEVLATPLTRKIAHFSQLLLYAILGLAAITFLIGLWHGDAWIDLFMAAVALSVAMIPEGLPAVLTITLALGVARMAKRRAIIRRLPAVETLGSTTVICSDKTGTLTRNEMTVQKLWAGGETFDISGVGYAPEGDIRQGEQIASVQDNRALSELLLAGWLCNDSLLKQDEEGWKIQGDPTEGALLVAARKAGVDSAQSLEAHPRLDSIPFESQHQYMATLHGGEKPLIYMKGSAESILARCDRVLNADGSHKALDSDAIEAQVKAIASQGQRVLAFACLEVASDKANIEHEDVAQGMTFLGLQGMIDPPREEAVQAVHSCQGAGIRVKMITGDHALTAATIAGEIGLDQTVAKGATPKVLTGRELESIPDEALSQEVMDTAVFARVTPEQKLRLVEALQARGEVVAMTGDGVNDAPALRRADIGVAMGITGTEVSKEAADMVLTDDNFATIEAAVEEGRGVFDNLIKFITWILPTNAGQGLVIIAAIVASQPLPVLPLQALWINMTTAVLLGLTLAFEPREPGIMARPPRIPGTPILSSEMIFRIIFVGLLLLIGSFGLFELALFQGASEAEARTIAVNVFAVGQSFYLLNCRSLRLSMFRLGLMSNPWIWVGIAAMMAAQMLFTYVPLMNILFHTAPIGLIDWFHIGLVGLAIYLIIGLEKIIRQRRDAATVPVASTTGEMAR
ncbi:potassium and/or sodium efflux P-type ATPase [Modicisalibacter ilicicola DSM 19980]|uniref:Potassium and/or sodium efflux P-type ATPase n=1 Tax=Modicisalibacter ilicicola DSM 19980 TaxID=1121942 RepID=A0A1M4YGX6_9GAMM|nr:cation-transporting P-type ATPase [Halomonas ilicicola]SHF04997.1 potassium and/or sodium efflux P-type ATPase [Halomonas ilicicola DSM 19980]